MEKTSTSNQQGRKVQLTINNPIDHGWTHEAIKTAIQEKLKSTVFACLGDEIGATGTYHTHAYLVFSSPVRFSTIKNVFDVAHIEFCRGSNEDNIQYIKKEGKWLNTEKGSTVVLDTYEQIGTPPPEKKISQRADLEELYNMLKAGASDFEIFERNAGHIKYVSHIEKVRFSLAQENFRHTVRPLMVIYLQGPSGSGKTTKIYSEYGYDQVFRVTNYSKHPFDGYSGEKVLLLDDFKDSLPLREILPYLEGMPLQLPARYSNKWAAYTVVVISSATKLEDQYAGAQYDDKELWKAFLRRIDKVVELLADGQQIEYSLDEYFSPKAKPPANYENPF